MLQRDRGEVADSRGATSASICSPAAVRVGEVEDAADAYVYAMGQTYTTGTILSVDGGTLVA